MQAAIPDAPQKYLKYTLTVPKAVLIACEPHWLSTNNACKQSLTEFVQVILHPISKVLVKILRLMQSKGYINEFTVIDDARAGKIVVDLNGRLNKCGVISPRFDLKLKNFENFTTSVLPSRQFGFVILTTNQGIMDHEEAKKKQIGGKVLGFFY